MVKKKLKKLNKKLKRRVPGYTIFFIIVAIVVATKMFVSCSIQDMENSAFRDESNQAIAPLTTSANVKQAVAYAFDPEAIIAQQIERAVSYRTQASVEPLLKNIQENIQYNRNKAAVWFYLAYAYEQIGNTPNAVAIYEKLRASYEDRHVMLYIFDAPREIGSKRVYSVALVAETKARQALLLGKPALWQELEKVTANYGEEGAETLPYAALASYNLKHKDQPLGSVDIYVRSLK